MAKDLKGVEAFDPLGGPFGADLVAGNTPYFLGVVLKK